jgi:glutamine cyclotransferase
MFRSVFFIFALIFANAAHGADCARPKELRFEVTGKIVRSEVGFTQGLEWRDGKFFESTGAVGGHSGLNTIAPDGTVTKLRDDGTR